MPGNPFLNDDDDGPETRYPQTVDKDDRPEMTVENIPDDVLHSVLRMAAAYGACPNCGHEQWYPIMAGHNTSWDCAECDFTMRVVG